MVVRLSVTGDFSCEQADMGEEDAHSGDDERSIRWIVNIDSGDHEHLLALA